jgi:lipopolysaccharide/colanic/teichoic acid biosynthesis glycosyltransferase
MGQLQDWNQTRSRHSTAPKRSLYRTAKRALDVVGAVVGLIVTAPVFAALALAIKLDSRGPVFFRQERAGENGIPFTLYKFRSMYTDTDDRLHREAFRRFRDGEVIGDNTLSRDPYKLTCDPRVTRVGRFIRTTSLDELPQLLNVLSGEMSLVGPRPALAYELALYESHHLRRLNVPQGITGLWQVYGRGRVAFDGAIALDLEYIERCSLLLDLKLLVMTIPVVLARRGAR